jgi:hypothetical protein
MKNRFMPENGLINVSRQQGDCSHSVHQWNGTPWRALLAAPSRRKGGSGRRLIKHGDRAPSLQRSQIYRIACDNVVISLLCLALLVFASCGKRSSLEAVAEAKPESAAAKFDACGLLTGAEIEAIVGSPLKETKSSGAANEGMRVSQCFYTAEEFSKSVSLAVTRSDPGSPVKRGANAYWEEMFGRFRNEEKEKTRESESDKEKKESLREQREKGKEEEEGGVPPKKISGAGDEAFWIGNRVGGALYVLKKDKDAFTRISVGGPDKEEIKIDKCKALAQKAINRL